MERKDVALGKAAKVGAGIGTTIEPTTLEERLAALEAKMELLIKLVTSKQSVILKNKRQGDPNLNKDGLPLYMHFMGISRGVPYVLTVRPDAYYVGTTPYATLSAAAKAVSGVRRSGWTFWKLPDGRTVKEAFNKE